MKRLQACCTIPTTRARLRTRSSLRRMAGSSASELIPSTSAILAKLRVVADRDHEIAIRNREHLIGHQVRMRVAHPPGRLARDEKVHRLIGEHRHLCVEQRKIDGRPARPCVARRSSADCTAIAA